MTAPYNIPAQLPHHVVAEYPMFVEFLQAYYDYMNQVGNPNNVIQNILNYRDIDNTVDSFREYIVNELMSDIPDNILADRSLLAKHIKELYVSKGSENSYRMLFRILFDKEIDINYPVDQILKLSDGRWSQNISFITHVSNFYTAAEVEGAIGQKILVNIGSKQLPVTVLNVVQLSTTDPDNNLYEFYIRKDFYDDFSVSTTFTFNKLGIINIVGGGTKYTNTDAVDILSIDGGGASASVGVTNGVITSVSLLDGGKGFIDAPIVNVVSTNGSGAYLQPIITPIYTGTILSSISSPTVVRSATGYLEGKVYPLIDGSGSDAFLQIKRNDDAQVRNVSVAAFGKYYPESMYYVINRDANVARATATVTNGVISGVTITYGGTGYVTPPVITIIGGGVDAEITCTLTGDSVTGYTIVNGGGGYTTPPALVFSDTSVVVLLQNNKLRTYNGAYLSTNGFTSCDMMIYDGTFFQKYSYEIVIDELFDSYKCALKKLLHPAGYAAWGIYDLQKFLQAEITSTKIDVERNSVFRDVVYYYETLYKDISKALDDTITPSEAMLFAMAKTLSESISPTDALAMNVSKPFSESVLPADIWAVAIAKALSESVVTSNEDINTRYVSGDYFAADYVTVIEAYFTIEQAITADTVTATDSFDWVLN